MHFFISILLPVLLSVVSAGAVLWLAIVFLKKNTESQLITAQSELKKERQKHFLPMRVDAYQRSALLMERIHPNSLIMRLHNPGLPAMKFQAELLQAIREEYNHNVSQQLFVSPQAWEMVKNSKEETIKIINLAGQQMQATSLSTDLAAKVFEIVAEVGRLPTEITVEYLRKELQDLF